MTKDSSVVDIVPLSDSEQARLDKMLGILPEIVVENPIHLGSLVESPNLKRVDNAMQLLKHLEEN